LSCFVLFFLGVLDWVWGMVLIIKKEQVTVPKACNEVLRTFYTSMDNTSTVLQAALLSVLEEQAVWHPLGATNREEILATTRRMRWLTRFLTRMSTEAEAHQDLLLRIEQPFPLTPERTDQRLWPLFLVNQAKIDAFSVGQPSVRYLETRKIFLPQGATLILLHWQSELDELITEIEEVSCSSRVWLEPGCCSLYSYNIGQHGTCSSVSPKGNLVSPEGNLATPQLIDRHHLLI
jgi:hypothetical protein